MTTMTRWHRVSFLAQTEDGGTRRTTVTLFDMTRRETDGPAGPGEVISGRVVDRKGDLTDTLQVILAQRGEAKVVPLVQDLISEKFVPADKESPESKKMRGRL